MSPSRRSGKKQSRTASGKRRRSPGGVRVLSFPLVRGKKIKKVEFVTHADNHCITLDFDDGTTLNFDIRPDPGFTLEPDYSDWSSGDWRLIKRWSPIRSKSEKEK